MFCWGRAAVAVLPTQLISAFSVVLLHVIYYIFCIWKSCMINTKQLETNPWSLYKIDLRSAKKNKKQ